MNIENTQTKINVQKAFTNETQAIVRYMIYAEIAQKRGHKKAAELFERMAKNELNHAKVWFNLLTDTSKSTEEHLKESAFSENEEWKKFYPESGKIAREEGFEEIGELFERIASIEADHERRFVELLFNESQKLESTQEKGKVVHEKVSEVKEKDLVSEEKLAKPSKEESNNTNYYCMFCGFPSSEELELCPVCQSPKPFIGN